jgi:peptide/nickel transport system ATP-binding protein
MSDAAPLIEVSHLQKFFGTATRPVRAVDDVSFEIHGGETLGLVGESGSGKSTIGRALLRLVESTGGSVKYRGEDLGLASGSRMRSLRSKLQMIFQDPYASLNPKMRVRDILGEALHTHALAKGKQATADRIAELLRLVGLQPEHAARFPHEFSPAASASASAWRAPCRCNPSSSSPTSRCPRWTSPSRRRW